MLDLLAVADLEQRHARFLLTPNDMSNQDFKFDLAPAIAALKRVDDVVRTKLVKESLTAGSTIIEAAGQRLTRPCRIRPVA